MKNRVAAYLQTLKDAEYGIPNQVSNLVNFAIDSYYFKLDERAKTRKYVPPRWIPDDPDSHIKEVFLGCEIHKVVSLNRKYPAFARNSHVWAFTRLFKEFAGSACNYSIIPFLDQYEFKDMLKGSSAYRIQSEQISIDLGVQVTLPIFGTFFVKHVVTGVPFVIKADFCYNSQVTIIQVMVNPVHAKEVEEFFRDLENSITKNDIYFMKCLMFLCGQLDFTAVTPTTWEEIILKDNIKNQIRDNSVNIIDNMEQLSKIGMCPNRNIIMISPPGMAKTSMFRAISNETTGKATRIWCTGKSIEYPEHVTSLFEAARALAPCIIFLEDADILGGSREKLHGSESRVLNELLTCLDGIQSNAGLVIMASTNDIESMDEALINRPGRFSVKIEIPFPDLEDRGKMLHIFLKAYKASPDGTVTRDSINTVLELCEGLTGDYLKELARTTVIRAVAEGRSQEDSVFFSADDLNSAAEQVVKNFKIGQKAKKHINVQVSSN